MVILRVDTVIIKTSCIHCGTPIEVEAKVYKGKDFFNAEWLKNDKIHPVDPYAFVHLLCEQCDLMIGFKEEAYKNKS
jgi:hypothetical protein